MWEGIDFYEEDEPIEKVKEALNRGNQVAKCDICNDPECPSNKGEKVNVEKGAKVRVTYDAIMDTVPTGNPATSMVTRADGSGGWFAVPEYARFEVLEKPIPPEPPVGTVLLVDGRVFTRSKNLSGKWLTDTGISWEWASAMGRRVSNAKSVVNLTDNGVDLSDVKPFESPARWDEKGTGSTTVKYDLCYGSNGDEVTVWLPDGPHHIRFKHGDGIFCLGVEEAKDIAKRILKTFGNGN